MHTETRHGVARPSLADECTRTRRTRVRGVEYALDDSGGDGPPVLLLHGWPDDRHVWRHQVTALATAGYRAIAVDWPAHGDSGTPSERSRYRIPELAADTVGLLDALGIDRAYLVAHDYGATVSWETVAAWPERFVGYCAISVGHSVEIVRDIVSGSLTRYAWLVLHGMPRTSRAWYLSNDARRFRRAFATHRDADAVLERLTDGRDQTFWSIWERANPSHQVLWRQLVRRHVTRRLPVPVLGIYSRGDEWMTAGQMRRSGRHVSGRWRHETIDGGHWIQLERPDAVDALLLGWLADIESTADES